MRRIVSPLVSKETIWPNVNVKVLDATGHELPSATFPSDEVVGEVPLAFGSKIEAWFGDPKMMEALK